MKIPRGRNCHTCPQEHLYAISGQLEHFPRRRYNFPVKLGVHKKRRRGTILTEKWPKNSQKLIFFGKNLQIT